MQETPVRERRRAPDASMDLLRQIQGEPMDPDYARVAAAPQAPTRRLRWPLVLVMILTGALIASAALATSRRAPALAGERAELITRIQTAESQLDADRGTVADLTAQIEQLRTDALGTDADDLARQDEIAALEPVVGTEAVRGPGLQITVDDAAGGTSDNRDRVLDLDLQLLANGLWQAGAEAVAINGHRLSALTAIRGAGDAITVDYRSLTRPYVVQAIGNPATLPAGFAESSGGLWWNELAQNRAMRFDTAVVQQLDIPADPGMTLRYAEATTR